MESIRVFAKAKTCLFHTAGQKQSIDLTKYFHQEAGSLMGLAKHKRQLEIPKLKIDQSFKKYK